MPVKKFRSIQEMKADRWLKPGDPSLPVVLQQLWERGTAGTRAPLPPGVYRHRSIESAKLHKEAWARARRANRV